MLKKEELLRPVALEALIGKVKELAL